MQLVEKHILMLSFPPTLLSLPGVALLRDFVSHCHDCSFFFSRDNEIEAGVSFFHSLIPFHFSPSICTTAMAASTSGRRVVNSSWSAVKRCSAEGPRWRFSWGWGTFLSCPPLWAGCLHLHMALCDPAWDPRETEPAEQHSHETFRMLGCVGSSTQCCKEGFVSNNHPKISVGLFSWWSALRMKTLLLCCFTGITWKAQNRRKCKGSCVPCSALMQPEAKISRGTI